MTKIANRKALASTLVEFAKTVPAPAAPKTAKKVSLAKTAKAAPIVAAKVTKTPAKKVVKDGDTITSVQTANRNNLSAGGDVTIVATVETGDSVVLKTSQMTKELTELMKVGASLKMVKAALANRKPVKPVLANGVTPIAAPHSAKAVSDGLVKNAKPVKAATAKAAPKTVGKEGDDRVIATVVANPKKPSSESFGRFAKYKVGMTVGQALAAGVTRGDIAWDSDAKRSFITFA